MHYQFYRQTPLTLSALADRGYGVNRWNGDICSRPDDTRHDDTQYDDTQCTFTVNTNENISITFRDNERPVIAAPQPIVVTLAPGNKSVNIQLSPPAVSDNVDSASKLVVTPYRAIVSDNRVHYERTALSQSLTAGEYEIVWRATDSAGNIGAVSQFITVNEFTQTVEDENSAAEFDVTNAVYLLPGSAYASKTNPRIDLNAYLIEPGNDIPITRYCSFSFLENTTLAYIDGDQVVGEEDALGPTPPIQAECRYKGEDYRAEWSRVVIWTGNACETSQQELLQNGDFLENDSSWTITGGFRANAAYSRYHTRPGYAYLAAPDGARGTNLSGSIYQNITINDSNEDIQDS